MECSSCHQIIPPDSRFCTFCGAAQAPPSKPIEIQEEVDAGKQTSPKTIPLSPGIMTGADGVFRWTFEMSLWKNATIPKTVAKVVILASMVPVLLVTFLTLEEGIVEAARVFAGVGGLVLAIMTVLFLLAYGLVSLVYGGKYCVVFEMDANGVKHIQMDKQFKKGQVLSMLTVLAGLAAGSPQTAGAGLLAGARKTSYTPFSKVISIKADQKNHVIYVNEIAGKNQVYAADADFQSVLDYLTAHCKKAKVSRKS